MPEEPYQNRQKPADKKSSDFREPTNAKPTDRPTPVDPATPREGAPRRANESEEAE